jgi:hypothetical protein
MLANASSKLLLACLITENEIWSVRTFINVETVTEDVEIGSYVSW